MILDRQEGIHKAEPLVPKASLLELEIAIEKVKIYKSPGICQILAELIQERDNTLYYEIQKNLLILAGIRKEPW
jgi:hypothetical protein